MSEHHTGHDPFGISLHERIWRRLAGAGIAVTIAATAVAAWTTEALPWVLLGTMVVYLLGFPASWWIVRRGAAPIRRHVIAAVLLAGAVAGLLALPDGLVGWPIYAVFAVGVGVPVAAGAAWAGLALPRHLVRPVALVGLIVAFVLVPVSTWLTQRPPAPYDFVVVHEPALIDTSLPDAFALAQLISAEFNDVAASSTPSRTAHATWVSIGRGLSDGPLHQAAHGMRFTVDDELPTLRSSDEPVRLVTVIFDDDPNEACVIVVASRSSVQAGGCAALDLAR